MATAHESEKSPAELEARVWELAEKLNFCMFTSSGFEGVPAVAGMKGAEKAHESYARMASASGSTSGG